MKWQKAVRFVDDQSVSKRQAFDLEYQAAHGWPKFRVSIVYRDDGSAEHTPEFGRLRILIEGYRKERQGSPWEGPYHVPAEFVADVAEVLKKRFGGG